MKHEQKSMNRHISSAIAICGLLFALVLASCAGTKGSTASSETVSFSPSVPVSSDAMVPTERTALAGDFSTGAPAMTDGSAVPSETFNREQAIYSPMTDTKTSSAGTSTQTDTGAKVFVPQTDGQALPATMKTENVSGTESLVTRLSESGSMVKTGSSSMPGTSETVEPDIASSDKSSLGIEPSSMAESSSVGIGVLGRSMAEPATDAVAQTAALQGVASLVERSDETGAGSKTTPQGALAENPPPVQARMPEQETNAITFSGGYTKVKLQEGREVVTLSNGAVVSVGSLQLTADEIEISGSDYRHVRCNGNVSVVDAKRGIRLSSSQIYYDRLDELIIVDGWVEIQDTQNEVIASGAWLEFNLRDGIMKMQMRVRLLKHTDKGSMVCNADNVIFDRDGETLALSGGASVYWNKDRYEASMITVDLKTDEIIMDGAIRGTVHG